MAERAVAKRHLYGFLHYLWEHDVCCRFPKWRESQNQVAYAEKCRAVHESLTEGQRLILNLYELTTEVNNGGVEQYFWNSSGDTAEALLLSLELLGADVLFNALLAARDEIFKGPVPADLETRRHRMQEYFGTHPFNDEDDQERLAEMRRSPAAEQATSVFYDCEDDLVQRVRDWVSENREHFGNQCSAT